MIAGRGFVFVILWALCSLVLASCEELRGPGGGETHQRVDVTVAVRPEGSDALVNGLAGSGTGQFGTSLIVVVAEGTAPLANHADLSSASVYDQALLDLTTSTVSLTVPLGTSLQLFEYTFNDILTQAQIETELPIGGVPNVSAPFAVQPDVTELLVDVPLTPTSFGEGFSGALDPSLWEQAGGVTSSGGVLQLAASIVFDDAATDAERATGDRARIRSNRNILLNSHRVAGTLAV